MTISPQALGWITVLAPFVAGLVAVVLAARIARAADLVEPIRATRPPTLRAARLARLLPTEDEVEAVYGRTPAIAAPLAAASRTSAARRALDAA